MGYCLKCGAESEHMDHYCFSCGELLVQTLSREREAEDVINSEEF